jgi:hypothetical protein
VKLVAEANLVQRALKGVDAVRHEERRALVAFGQEVAHRAIERTGHPDRDAVHRDKRERTVDRAHGGGVAPEYAAARLVDADVVQLIEPGIEQVHQLTDGTSQHGGHCMTWVLRYSALRSSSAPVGHE